MEAGRRRARPSRLVSLELTPTRAGTSCTRGMSSIHLSCRHLERRKPRPLAAAGPRAQLGRPTAQPSCAVHHDVQPPERAPDEPVVHAPSAGEAPPGTSVTAVRRYLRLRPGHRDIGLYLLVVAAGTVVRLLWAGHVEPWSTSVDNHVWTTLLNAPGEQITLDRLVPYPHEMGSVFYSLAALLRPPEVGGWPALNVVALVMDTLMRLGMIVCAAWIFGRSAAVLFGAWTIVATPLVLEWSVLLHGMHGNAALWPLLSLALVR